MPTGAGRETVARFEEIRDNQIRSAGSVVAARGAIPIAWAGTRSNRSRRRDGSDSHRATSTDRRSRPAVSCFSRACLLARRIADPCVAPSPLERVSSEKVRPGVPDFSDMPPFSRWNRLFWAVFIGWGISVDCVPRSRNAGSRRGAGRHRTGSDRLGRDITTALRDRATLPARPCRRSC